MQGVIQRLIIMAQILDLHMQPFIEPDLEDEKGDGI